MLIGLLKLPMDYLNQGNPFTEDHELDYESRFCFEIGGTPCSKCQDEFPMSEMKTIPFVLQFQNEKCDLYCPCCLAEVVEAREEKEVLQVKK